MSGRILQAQISPTSTYLCGWLPDSDMASRRRKWMRAKSPGEPDHRQDRARFIRPVGRRAHRVLLPKAISGTRFNLKRREALTKLCLWYLARRRQSEGPHGLIYAVPMLPPSHSFDSVIEALDNAIATLKSEPPSPVAWDNPGELRALHDHSPTLIPLPLAPRGTSVSNRSLPGAVVMPPSIHDRLPQANPVFIPEPEQIRSRLCRKAGRSDLRAPAVELPVPPCLQVGRLTVDPAIAPKPSSRDSLHVSIPLCSNQGQLPRSLQAGVGPPSRSLGGDAEISRLSSAADAADVVRDSLKFQLSPLEPGLGDFSCDFPSDHLCENSQGRCSDTTSTDVDGLDRIGIDDCLVELRDASRPSSATPPLPPLPLARGRILRERLVLGRTILDRIVLEHIIPVRIAWLCHRILADHGLPQPTTPTALLYGQDVSEIGPDEAEGRSDGIAFIRDTEGSIARRTDIFPPRSEMVSPSDTTHRPQPPSQHGAEPPSSSPCSSSSRQPRPRTALTLEDRRKKGRGMVFY